MPTNEAHHHVILSVGVILLKAEKVLLGLRKGPRSPGKFGLPGGFIESAESVETAAHREILEETGLKRIILNPAAPLRWTDGEYNYFDFIFYGYCEDGAPVVNESHRSEGWGWYSFDKPPLPLYEPTKLALERFIHDLRFRKSSLLLRKLLFRYKRIMWFED